MFGKMNMSNLKKSMANMKRFAGRHAGTLGKKYLEIKDGLNQLDRHMDTAKKVYNNVSPTLQEISGDKITSRVNKSLASYDTIRDRLVSNHNTVERHANNIVGGLKKEGIQLSF